MNLTNDDLKNIRAEQFKKMQECKDDGCMILYDVIITFLNKYIEE